MDFILGPSYCGVAAVLGESQYWNYTAIWNILDLPSVTFPSGVIVDPSVDTEEAGFTARNEVEAREWKKWSAGRYEGAPVGLQLAGRQFKDEETLAAAAVVEGILAGRDMAKL